MNVQVMTTGLVLTLAAVLSWASAPQAPLSSEGILFHMDDTGQPSTLPPPEQQQEQPVQITVISPLDLSLFTDPDDWTWRLPGEPATSGLIEEGVEIGPDLETLEGAVDWYIADAEAGIFQLSGFDWEYNHEGDWLWSPLPPVTPLSHHAAAQPTPFYPRGERVMTVGAQQDQTEQAYTEGFKQGYGSGYDRGFVEGQDRGKTVVQETYVYPQPVARTYVYTRYDPYYDWWCYNPFDVRWGFYYGGRHSGWYFSYGWHVGCWWPGFVVHYTWYHPRHCWTRYRCDWDRHHGRSVIHNRPTGTAERQQPLREDRLEPVRTVPQAPTHTNEVLATRANSNSGRTLDARRPAQAEAEREIAAAIRQDGQSPRLQSARQPLEVATRAPAEAARPASPRDAGTSRPVVIYRTTPLDTRPETLPSARRPQSGAGVDLPAQPRALTEPARRSVEVNWVRQETLSTPRTPRDSQPPASRSVGSDRVVILPRRVGGGEDVTGSQIGEQVTVLPRRDERPQTGNLRPLPQISRDWGATDQRLGGRTDYGVAQSPSRNVLPSRESSGRSSSATPRGLTVPELPSRESASRVSSLRDAFSPSASRSSSWARGVDALSSGRLSPPSSARVAAPAPSVVEVAPEAVRGVGVSRIGSR